MPARRRPLVAWAVLGLCGALGAAPLPAEEPVMLSEGSGGILDLEGETKLEIVGLRGVLAVRLGKDGEIRFAARSIRDRSAERPVALWLDGSTLRLTALEGAGDEPIRLEVTVSSGLDTVIRANDSQMEIVGLHGEVDVAGERLDITGRTLAATLALDLVDSSVQVVGVTEGVDLEGKQTQARFESVTGPVTFGLDGGRLVLNHILGEVDGALQNAGLAADALLGGFRIDADGESVALAAGKSDGTLRLTDSALDVREHEGSIEVNTDAEVRFAEIQGSLRIESQGGAVRGVGSRGGSLEIQTFGAMLRLEKIDSEMMVRGDNLDVEIKQSKGDLTLSGSGSKIVVEESEGAVAIQNEFGDVLLKDCTGSVQVYNSDGDVRVMGAKGKVEVKASSHHVEVQWAALSGHDTNLVENLSGDVRVTIPPNFRARVDAEARGQVESAIESLQVTDDGHFATGVLLGGRGPAPHVKQPVIRLKAGGDLYVDAGGAVGRP